jgi:CMP-N,N'-diacetyllegionaminic acid synthase
VPRWIAGVFDSVVCATDSERYARIARHYGAEVPALRPNDISGDRSPDIDWVTWLLDILQRAGREFDAFSILRPTSPFRQSTTIRRAWEHFTANPTADSLRAVQKCRQHPGKMWVLQKQRLLPLMPFTIEGTPWHSSQYAALPEVFVQDASLEIAWTRTAREFGTIAGQAVVPFFSHALEGFDINEPEDWMLAQHYLASKDARLPEVPQVPFMNNEEQIHHG